MSGIWKLTPRSSRTPFTCGVEFETQYSVVSVSVVPDVSVDIETVNVPVSNGGDVMPAQTAFIRLVTSPPMPRFGGAPRCFTVTSPAEEATVESLQAGVNRF